VYEKLIFDGATHYSIASFPGMANRTVTVNSLSKTYSMTGWRIGYLAASKSMTTQILKVLQYSATNINPFVQMAAITALTHSETNHNIKSICAEYSRRRNLGLEAISTINGIGTFVPEGAFYLMLDIAGSGFGSIEFASRLIDEFGVAVVPGVAFGASAEGWIRLTFSSSPEELIEGIRRIGSFFERHSVGRRKML
jgi:aspartate/methionine/tyrosine aminotransferase